MRNQASLAVAETNGELADILRAVLAAHGFAVAPCPDLDALAAHCRRADVPLAVVSSDLVATDADWRALAGLPGFWIAVAPTADGALSARLRQAGAATVILRGDDLPGRLANLLDLLASFLQEHDLLRNLRELALGLGRCRDRGAIFTAVITAILRVPEFDAAGIYLVDEDDAGIRLVHHQGVGPAFAAGVRYFPRDFRIGRVIFAGQSAAATAADLLPETADIAAAEGLQAVVTVPVWHEDHVVGAVTGASHTHSTFSDFARLGFETVAAHIGGALARARAEHNLRASEAQYQALTEGSPDLIIRLGHDNTLLYANATFETLTGLPRARGLGKPLTELGLPPACCTKIADAADAVRRTRAQTDVQIEIDNLEGTRILDLRLIPEPAPDDQPSDAVVAVGRDMTHTVHAAQRLLRAQRMDAFGQLANRMANDFNNQLASIMGFAGLLEDRVRTDPALAAPVADILAACRRSADITAQLLAFARQEKPADRTVDLNHILNDIANTVRDRFPDRVWVKIRLDARPAEVRGNPAELRRALLALAWNACEAMPDGGELLLTTATRHRQPTQRPLGDQPLPPGPYLEITVTDTGSGMDPNTQAHIFEPFFTTKEGDGKGMGLAAVYGTIHRHRGAITVTSAPGRGTTMTVLLPSPAPDPDTSPAAPAPRRAHVLVVDDDPTLRRFLDQALTELGYRVSVCDDGLAAIEFHHRHPDDVDLVILDLIMPEFDGRATLQALRETAPDLPVILTSGQELTDDERTELGPRMAAFLLKPYPINHLANTVAAALGN